MAVANTYFIMFRFMPSFAIYFTFIDSSMYYQFLVLFEILLSKTLHIVIVF